MRNIIWIIGGIGVSLLAGQLLESRRHTEQVNAALRKANDRLRTREKELFEREIALHASEAELVQAQHVAHIGSWFWDARTDCGRASEELLRIFGFEPATQTIPKFADQRGLWYPPEEWDRLNIAVQEAGRTGVGFDLEVQALRNGHRIWVQTRSEAMRDADGHIVGLRGTVQDITERKQVEEALRESEEQFRIMFTQSPVGNAQADLATGRFMRVNRLFCQITGYSEAELLQRTFLDITHPDDRQRDRAQYEALLHGDIRAYDVEKRYIHADGRVVVCLGTVTLVSDVAGHARYVLGSIQDITTRKLAEQELQQLNSGLKKVNAELNFFNSIMIDRELRMIELKKEVDELCRQYGLPLRYGYTVPPKAVQEPTTGDHETV